MEERRHKFIIFAFINHGLIYQANNQSTTEKQTMPIPFGVSKDDILRSKTIIPGWYAAVVKAVNTKAAKTDGSMNVIFTFKLTGGAYDGTPVDTLFSEKAPGFAVPLMEALLKRKVNPEGEQFDFEKAVGQELLVYVKNEEYQGRMLNKAADFKPKG